MSLPQRVTKTHATGNDFVVYLDKSGKFEPTADEVRFLCDRHFGIGGDGLIRLTRPDFVSDLSDDQLSDVLAGGAKWFMDYRNADGSLAEMCGNGTRAITLFAQRDGVADSTEPFRLGTRAGRQDSDATRQYEAVRSQRVPGRNGGVEDRRNRRLRGHHPRH